MALSKCLPPFASEITGQSLYLGVQTLAKLLTTKQCVRKSLGAPGAFNALIGAPGKYKARGLYGAQLQHGGKEHTNLHLPTLLVLDKTRCGAITPFD